MVCLIGFLSTLYGCLKAHVVIPIHEKISVKIETKDKKEPVIVNGQGSGCNKDAAN